MFSSKVKSITRTIKNQKSQAKLKSIGRYRLRMAALMFLADMLGFSLAGISLCFLNILFRFYVFQWTDLRYSFILLICLLLFMTTKLYPGVGLNPADEIKLVLISTTASFLISTFFIGLVTMVWRPNYWAFFPLGFLTIVFVLFMRWLIRILAVQLSLWGEPIIIIGRASHLDKLVSFFGDRYHLGFLPVLAVAECIGKKVIKCPVPVIDLNGLRAMNDISGKPVETILIDAALFSSNGMSKVYEQLSIQFHNIIFISDLDWLGGASLQPHDYEGLLGLEVRRPTINPINSILKRLVDISISILGLFFIFPFLLLIAFLIKVESSGPMFFSQRRVGFNGSIIQIYKFRTMVLDADRVLKAYLKTNTKARDEWAKKQKLCHDPRVTRVGKFLRKYSLDEIPQLVNVLKGEMSLVGPRPIMLDQLKLYGDNVKIYHNVRPGITGLWQVSGRNHTSFQERVGFDMYYIKNWSIWLDTYIVLRTAWVVLRGDGAY